MNRRNFFKSTICASLLGLVVANGIAAPAWAHEVSPIRAYINVGRGEASTVVSVRNTRDRNLPIEIVALRRDVATDGSETLVDASAQFLVFPTQFMIAKGASQSVRIEYVGDRALKQSQSYLIDVREVPVVPEGFTGVFTAYNFGVALYIVAPSVRPELAVSDIALKDGKVTFRLANTGGEYAILTRERVTLEFPGGPVEITPSDFVTRLGSPIVPPNAVRDFTYTPPPGTVLTAAPTTIRIRQLR